MNKRTVRFEAAGAILHGDLIEGRQSAPTVIIADGGGRTRLSSRSQLLATQLSHAEISVLLLDLLTAAEAMTDPVRALRRLDAGLMAGRLRSAAQWLARQAIGGPGRTGIVATTNSVGPSLLAAAHQPDLIQALVCVDGRPNICSTTLASVFAPTMLIARSDDPAAVELNEHAVAYLSGPHALHVLPDTGQSGADGSYAAAGEHATRWFAGHLGQQAEPAQPS